MKLWFVLGTAAELIKVYPLIHKSIATNSNWEIIASGQSEENFNKQLVDFNIPSQKVTRLLSGNSDLKTSGQAITWVIKLILVGSSNFLNILARDRFSHNANFIVVHGDTLTTLMGAIIGRMIGAKIIHVEAGMRSGKMLRPFPEEINRRVVSRFAHIHFASDNCARENLNREGIYSNVVVTNGNTIVDSLRLSSKASGEGCDGFILFNIHRFENLHSPVNWKKIIDLMVRLSSEKRIIFVAMPPTLQKLGEDVYAREVLEKNNIEVRARLPFMQFASLLRAADYLVSDGGSNQQECYYLGKPCLIMRNETESIEGIGGCCVLSRFENKTIDDFVLNYKMLETKPNFPAISPVEIIWESLNL